MRSEENDWSKNEANFLAPDLQAKIKNVLSDSPIILEHRFYRGGRAPTRLIFDAYEDLQNYINSHSQAGDHFFVWRYDNLCRDDNALVSAKYPDAMLRTPRGGAY